MVVSHMRIYDRLIHGQIVTAWIKDSGANVILVADDAAAKDATQKMLLQLATPKHVKLLVESITNAGKILADNTLGDNVLVIVRNPKTAFDLFETGFKIDTLNVGNISNSKSITGRKRLLPFIYLEEQDFQNLKKIADLGIRLDIRSVPTDHSIDGLDFITKNY